MDVPQALVCEYLTLVDDSNVAIIPHLLRIAVDIGVCDVVGDHQMNVEDLAAVVQADTDSLYRLLRALASIGILAEPFPRCFGLAPVGRRLKSDASDSVRESVANLDSLQAWVGATGAVRSGDSAFHHIYKSDFFSHKDENVDANRSFLRRMRERASYCYGQMSTIVDWQLSDVILDIGGGDGYILERILNQAQQASGMLFDRPSVISLVEEGGHLDYLDGRCHLMAGDFFQGLPGGANVHLMCSILHNWADGAAAAILRNSREVLAENGRLLIVEMIVPPDDEWHPSKLSDIGMMILTGGKERTEEEFDKLLSASGYRLSSVRSIPGSYFSMLEAV